MKLLIDIPDKDYEFIKEAHILISGRRNCKQIEYNIINAIKNGTPIQLVTNAEEAEAYPINQEENCKIVREFLRDVINVKNLPVCKKCSTCEHCKKKYKKLPKIIWMNDCPFIFCTRHHEHFAPSDTCEFWKGGEEE